MINEATHCADFSKISTSTTAQLSEGQYFTVNVEGQTEAVVKLSESMSAIVIYLGSDSATFETESSALVTLDDNGIWFK